MVILHIAAIKDNPFSGVCVIVPQHIEEQQKKAEVGFINIKNEKIRGVKNQFAYSNPFDVVKLPNGFSKPDLVIFHEVYVPQYLKIAANLRKRKIPYIIVPHGGLTKEAQSKKAVKKKIANLFLFNRFVKNAGAIQCLSERELKETNYKIKKFVGTNGVNIPQKRKERFSEKETKIVYIGRLDSFHKGLDLLADAVKACAGFIRKNNCKIYIYGPDYQGRYENVKRIITERHIEDILVLNREVTGEQKENIMLDSDIFIQTSRFEGMPLGILEALSYGIPCLVTEGTNMSTIIGRYNSGWSCRTDSDSIAKTIIKALEEKEIWKEKSEKAKILIEENFEWGIVADKAIVSYKEYVR